jgi:anti-sigma B factor antagonist
VVPDFAQPSGSLPLRTSRPTPTTVVLHVAGEVDILTTPALDGELTRQLGTIRGNLVVDLTEVSFFASSGLAVLMRAAHTAEEHGVRLVLVAASRTVLRPLEVTRTASQFVIFESLDEALAHCG